MTEIEQIKEALSKITQGEWMSLSDAVRLKSAEESDAPLNDGWICQMFVKKGDMHYVPFENDEENAKFIANAPTWISSLITTIESQTERIEWLIQIDGERKEDFNNHADSLKSKVKELDEKEKIIESQKEEIVKWKKEALANHPTQWAYDQACKALNGKTLALESLQKENETYRKIVQKSLETLMFYSKWEDGGTKAKQALSRIEEGEKP